MRTALRSSLVRAVSYDEETQTLTVELVRGGSYEYPGVPRAVYQDFVAAASPGHFWNQQIKGLY